MQRETIANTTGFRWSYIQRPHFSDCAIRSNRLACRGCHHPSLWTSSKWPVNLKFPGKHNYRFFPQSKSKKRTLAESTDQQHYYIRLWTWAQHRTRICWDRQNRKSIKRDQSPRRSELLRHGIRLGSFGHCANIVTTTVPCTVRCIFPKIFWNLLPLKFRCRA